MLDTLEYYRPRKYAELIAEGRAVLDKYPDFGYVSYLWPKDDMTLDEIDKARDELESISWLIHEDLYNAMQDISPAGCSYGSHFGDGALMGFWPDEDSDLWE
jgi:hypothetical protein